MMTSATSNRTSAVTRLEVLIAAALIAILLAAAHLHPGAHPTAGEQQLYAQRAGCINQLKQIGLAFGVFAEAQDGEFPTRVFLTNDGAMEFIARGEPAIHFGLLSNELQSPRVLVCPSDTRQAAANSTPGFATLHNQNVSYFLSMDAARTTTNTILAGDRNLKIDGGPVRSGPFSLTRGTALNWARGEMHSKAEGNPCGNILFADGSVRRTTTNLEEVLRKQDIPTNRIAIP